MLARCHSPSEDFRDRAPHRALVVLAACAVIAAAGCGGGEGEGDRAAAPAEVIDAPTVLLVTIDTLRADRVGAYGKENAGTPTLDALAEAGALFENAQATSPVTLPSHASVLTGRSLPAHGVFNNGTFALPEGVPTLATRLADAGYDTAAFVSAPVLAERYGLDAGFRHYDDEIPKPPPTRTGVVVHYEERSGQETARRALAWLAARGTAPAFVWVHIWEPHAPYIPPPEFAERFPNDRYQGEVAAADAAVARLLREIRAMGRGDQLLTIVTADHGEGLGEHGEPTHGIYLYQGTMRVPLVFHGPHYGIAERRIVEPASLSDIAPTVIEMLGVQPLPSIDGLSLAGAVRGDGVMPERRGVFAESHLPRLEFGWSGLRAMVTNDLVKIIEAPRPELYRLDEDPKEADDLAAENPERVEALRGALSFLLGSAEEHAEDLSSERAISEEELAQLRSLGYAASGRVSLGEDDDLVDDDLVDPKDRAEFIERYDEAIAMTTRGEPANALPLFERLGEIEPDNPSLLFHWGQAQIAAGRHDAAQETYRKLTKVDPSFGQAWYRLGQLLDAKGEHEGALAAYTRASQLDRFNVEPRKARASLLAQLGRVREAIEVLEEAKEIAPRDRAIQGELDKLWARMP